MVNAIRHLAMACDPLPLVKLSPDPDYDWLLAVAQVSTDYLVTKAPYVPQETEAIGCGGRFLSKVDRLEFRLFFGKFCFTTALSTGFIHWKNTTTSLK